ncbi:formylglycine-generating enzyme family protein [Paracoccaceae bacterium]|nr:formylglycine-generating enzyme family protein [Paracoccaceae bacterium]
MKIKKRNAQSCTSDTRQAYAENVIWIKGGLSHTGTARPVFPADGEGPIRAIKLSTYGLSRTAVTNAEFAAFVADTGYETDALRIGWSFVFRGLNDVSGADTPPGLPWWTGVDGATWDCPHGPGSTWHGIDDHPVVQISHNDAAAFAAWAGGRLPTEVEWEHAARGGPGEARYPWGEDDPDEETIFCNIWQGQFPALNTNRDGFYGTCPVHTFDPNALGFYNMVGNVWEWCADPFKIRSISQAAKKRNAVSRREKERLVKGGSFLCHASYCWRYRIAARTGRQPDNSSSHVGFRIAFDQPE